MAKKKSSYKKNGPDLEHYKFSSNTESVYVKTAIKSIALKIARKRVEARLSQEALAELTELSISTIRFIECQQRIPSLPVLAKIMYVLDRHKKIWP